MQARGIDGRVRDVVLSRTVPLASVSGMQPRKTPIYEVLPNGYGYIDLARLPNAEAHKALDAVLKTPAIVFDMRGYPNGTAWPLAPRLTSLARTSRPHSSDVHFSRPSSSTATTLAAARRTTPLRRSCPRLRERSIGERS